MHIKKQENAYERKLPNMDYDADEVIGDFKSKFKWPKKDEVEVIPKPESSALSLASALLTIIAGGIVIILCCPQ